MEGGGDGEICCFVIFQKTDTQRLITIALEEQNEFKTVKQKTRGPEKGYTFEKKNLLSKEKL